MVTFFCFVNEGVELGQGQRLEDTVMLRLAPHFQGIDLYTSSFFLSQSAFWVVSIWLAHKNNLLEGFPARYRAYSQQSSMLQHNHVCPHIASL